ncbi:UNVERIFIED_CONTAM: hypothetical protein RF653_06260 [Kocuria sp. CPCC 205316]|uniref:hypothetical protein n=1 Tax=Kocuria TaxID=57493 RepID=UPI0036DD242F
MTSSMRRSRAAAVRLALLSGLATLGWLLLGASGAHAAEGSAGELGSHFGGTVRDVLPAEPLAVAPPPAPAPPVGLRSGPVVEEVVGTVRGLPATGGELAAPVADAADGAVASVPVAGGTVVPGTVGTATRESTGPVEDLTVTVGAAARPVTGTVDEPLDRVSVVGHDPVAVAGLPPLGHTPVGAPALPATRTAPLDTVLPPEAPGTPARSDPAPSRDAPPEARVVNATASAERGPAASAERQLGGTVTPTAVPTSGTGASSSAALLRSAARPETGTGAAPRTGAPGVAPGGTGSSSSGTGSAGSPFGDAGSGAWPGVPREAAVLDLTARPAGGPTVLLRAAVEELPTSPASDPGSTPD